MQCEGKYLDLNRMLLIPDHVARSRIENRLDDVTKEEYKGKYRLDATQREGNTLLTERLREI